MKWIKLVLSGLLLFTFLDASDAKVEKVIVTGIGIDKEKAMKNASQTAIQQVVGSYVVSDSLVTNGKLIKDEVLNYSNGFITKFTTIKEGKNEDDLYEIQAEVVVEVGKLAQKLGQLNIAMKNVATNEFKVKTMDSFDSKKDFKTLADEIIYKPMRENAKIYDIQILGFEPTEYNDVTKSLYSTYDKKELEQISLGELLPFKLSFKMKLDNNYISSVKSFLEKSSKSTDEGPAEIRDMNSIVFGKIPASLKIEGREITLKNNFEITKVYRLSSANGNIMEVLSSRQKLTPIVSIKLLDESNEKIKRYVYTYSFGKFQECKDTFSGCAQVSDRTAICSKMLYVGDKSVVGYNYENVEYLVGLPLVLSNESNLFSVNEFPINALLFLTKDEASKVKNIKIEVTMGHYKR